ncbi:MAG: DUF1987 domain-containing protein [Bacteroidales bacterium]|nr:DUF1987 domain-containing protein [Bacteroidales bacterium]MBN2756206.1 DUF1987 domain-containing protein [Bacteroidales bacterium]
MQSLIIKATEDTPEIIFDPENEIFSISNVSLPENAIEFYAPVLSWLKKYRDNPLPETVFNFNIEYLNTASSKQVFELIFLIDKINEVSDVTVFWHYDSIDEDMQALGIRFTHLVKVKFELVPYEKELLDEDDEDY